MVHNRQSLRYVTFNATLSTQIAYLFAMLCTSFTIRDAIFDDVALGTLTSATLTTQTFLESLETLDTMQLLPDNKGECLPENCSMDHVMSHDSCGS